MKLIPILILLGLPGSSEPNLGLRFKTPRGSLGQGEREKKEEDLKGRRWHKVVWLGDASLARPPQRC